MASVWEKKREKTGGEKSCILMTAMEPYDIAGWRPTCTRNIETSVIIGYVEVKIKNPILNIFALLIPQIHYFTGRKALPPSSWREAQERLSSRHQLCPHNCQFKKKYIKRTYVHLKATKEKYEPSKNKFIPFSVYPPSNVIDSLIFLSHTVNQFL